MRYRDGRDGNPDVEGEREHRRQEAADAEAGHGGDATGRDRHNEEKRLEHEVLALSKYGRSCGMSVATVADDRLVPQSHDDSA
jgi:hypothetical protein